MLYSQISLLIHSKGSSLHLLTSNSQSIPLPPFPLCFLFLFGCAWGMWKFLGGGLNPNRSSENAKSLMVGHQGTSYYIFSFSSSPFFFLNATPVVCGSSWTRDWIQASAVTYAAAVAMPDPLTHCARKGPKDWTHAAAVILLIHCTTVGIPLLHFINIEFVQFD